MNRIGWAVVVMSVGAGACASAPPPNDRMASSEAAIRGAREVGAEQIPQGALELSGLAPHGMVRLMTYKDGFHEVFNDLDREHVIRDLTGWLDAVLVV